jgi:ABC-type uncharacterized transport system YnjBCD ATPase subunit
MPIVDALVQCPLHDSFRVRQVAGIFDVTLPTHCQERFKVEVPGGEENWQIGVIVGPSGSGKSSIARQAFGDQVHVAGEWPTDRAVVDGFGDLPIREIVGALTAVGFSSPPSWIKPYAVLSNGEKFRCDLARALLDNRAPIAVFDEFTSVVDRTVAKIASAAVAKAIRSGRLNRRFVAVTCHYDVVPWLEPDWVVDMASQSLARGRLCRPHIELQIRRVDRSWWPLFKRHHYLSSELHRAAACFVGLVENSPATFTAVLSFPHPTRPGWREHRTVCLPDFQGIGIGNAMSEFVAGVYRATGKPYYSTTSHPSMIRHRCRSPLWRVTRMPTTLTSTHQDRCMAASGSAGRLTGGFEYVGPRRDGDARRLGVIGVGGASHGKATHRD